MTRAEKERERKRQAEQEKLLRQLQLLIFNIYMQTLTMAGVKRAIAQGNDRFYFSQNATANASMNRELSRMAKQMDALLLNGIERSWKQGEEDIWDKMQLLFSKDARRRKAIDQLRIHATESHRKNAAQAFYNEKQNGLNISDRVWNLSGNAKKEMEVIIQNGIKEGKSAEEIQRSIRGYLKEPDKLFRRVRNKETGELEWSDAAKKYKPGQGVYRSAYKNAMRLARTEINAAYRQAQWEQYQNDPTVVGIRIELSNNHTTLVNGVPVPFYDICDELRGVYPKTFQWTGWHPQCRCQMHPVLMSDDEYRKLVAAENEGKQYTPKQITKMPKAFEEWVKKNESRAKGWASLPRFIRDNMPLVKGWEDLRPEGMRVDNVEQNVLRETIPTCYPNITKEVESIENTIRANAKFETAVAFDAEGNIVLDKRGQATEVGITVEEGKRLKDCVLTHNHPRGWGEKEGTLKRIGNSFSIDDISLGIKYDLAEIRAVTPLYTFSMKRPEGGWGISVETLKMEFSRLEGDVRIEQFRLIDRAQGAQRNVSMQRAETMHYHLIWKRFSEKYGIEYTKIKSAP